MRGWRDAAAYYTEKGPKCKKCNDTGFILDHPEGVPFSQSYADLQDCPDCNAEGEKE